MSGGAPAWLSWLRIDQAPHVAELRMRLPLDDESAEAAGIRLERVRARLN